MFFKLKHKLKCKNMSGETFISKTKKNVLIFLMTKRA